MNHASTKTGGAATARAAGTPSRLAAGTALRVIARGGYVKYRVFFADEETAIAAGYRPCGTCCKGRYIAWKARQNTETKR